MPLEKGRTVRDRHASDLNLRRDPRTPHLFCTTDTCAGANHQLTESNRTRMEHQILMLPSSGVPQKAKRVSVQLVGDITLLRRISVCGAR